MFTVISMPFLTLFELHIFRSNISFSEETSLPLKESFLYTGFSVELFVPTNALRQFFHCFLYYYDAPILKIPPDDGRITAEMRIGAS
jgi:hypothetical protein